MVPAPPPTRPPQFTGSGATVVALLSMALAMQSGGITPGDARSATHESATVREIAVAVVAAAAKNLMGSTDRLDATLSASPVACVEGSPQDDGPRSDAESVGAYFRVLDERLLDLPPPAC